MSITPRDGNPSTGRTPVVFQASQCSHPCRCSDSLSAAVGKGVTRRNALVIGEYCSNCTPEQAHSKIWGYTIANDVTARDLQKRDNQWARAKGFDTFCPLGPWIVRELSPAAQLQTFVNESERPVQSSQVNPHGIFPRLSRLLHQSNNDPNSRRCDTHWNAEEMATQIGDRVRIEIEGIGSLENTVVISNG